MFLGVGHEPDGRLDVPEDRLHQHVLLLHHLLLVKQLLHRLVVALLRVERQILQLLLVLTVVQNGRGEYHIFVDFGVKIGESGPLAGVDLHDIKHHLVLNGFLGVVDITDAHSLEQPSLLVIE